MTRIAAVGVSLALLGATVSPVLREPSRDGFPLSTYPMFAFPRPTTLTMDYALGVTASGERRALPPVLVGSVETLQVFTVIAQARAGHRLPALCRSIAARVAASAGYADVSAVRIVTGTHDAVEFLVRHHIGTEIERETCEVPR